MKDKDIHFRINRQLLTRFESALRFEGLSKTEYITYAIEHFCAKAERMQRSNLIRQYAISDSLLTRTKTHAQYEERRVDMDGACIEAMQLTGDEAILDVGCGPGAFLIRLARNRHQGPLAGLDQSDGMIKEAQSIAAAESLFVDWIVGDANRLPFQDGYFKRVAAKHMLYHMPNPEETLVEFKRVLAPEGIAIFTTNSAHSTPRIFETFNRMLLEFGYREVESAVVTFSMENAPSQLNPVFGSVEEIRYPNALIFQEAAPIVSYIFSMFPFFHLPDDQEMMAEMRGWLTADIRRTLRELDGRWHDPKEAVLYICRR